MQWSEFMELGRDVPDTQLHEIIKSQKPNQCCTLIYTSGTTGQPKGVMLSHDNVSLCVSAHLKNCDLRCVLREGGGGLKTIPGVKTVACCRLVLGAVPAWKSCCSTLTWVLVAADLDGNGSGMQPAADRC